MNYTMLSTDAGAPVLTGENGTLANLLTKCIGPDGYGSVSVSGMTRSGSVVTVNTTAPHGFQDYATVRISGAAEADYNGKWRVASVVDSDTFTFDIGVLTPATPATGTIAVKRGTPDWPVAFTGTNKVALRMPAGSNQHYLDVDDNAVDSARSALVRGYRTMTAVGTGTEIWPTVAQQATSCWRKSNLSSSAARAWAIIADDYGFWLAIFWHGSHTDAMELYAFGQDVAFNSADAYATRLVSAGTLAGAATAPHRSNGPSTSYRYLNTATGCWLAGDIAGSPGSSVRGDCDVALSAAFNAESRLNAAIPGLITGDQIISQAFAVTPDSSATKQVRGRIPGWYPALYAQDAVTNFSVRSDFSEYPGRRFMVMRSGSAALDSGRNPQYFDIDGPWR